MTEKKLLILLREVVAARASFRCEYPGCSNTNCSPHHVGGRGNNVLFDPDTCINLCDGINGHHVTGMVSAHGTPHFFKAIIIEKNIRTAEWFDEVARKKNVIVKDTKEFRAECGEKLKAELRRIAA